ncbi:MAG: ABC transporter permease [Thermoanaerobaculia bacterium]
MTFAEALRSALENLARHKLRTGLTMLGMIFGVGAVIAMLSIGAGAEQQAMDAISRLGVQNVIVRAKELGDDEKKEIRRKSLGVSLRDAEAIREAVPSVATVLPRIEVKSWKILGGGSKSDAKVFGVSHKQAEVARMDIAEGRFFDAMDESGHAQVCVIGAKVRRALFGYTSPLGKSLKINDVWFEVVGVLADEGAGATSAAGIPVSSAANEIFVPVTTAMRKFDREPIESPVDELIVRLRDDASPNAAARALRPLLERLHGGADDYEIVVPEALLEQSRKTQRIFNIVMGSIAGISLLVGGIGIMNIMLASVLERTREIGVRRALGARREDIRTQFMIESFTISAIGGFIGVAFGIAMARGVAAWADWPTVITAGSLLLSTGVSVAVGLASGMYPANRAARLDPIEALRYE